MAGSIQFPSGSDPWPSIGGDIAKGDGGIGDVSGVIGAATGSPLLSLGSKLLSGLFSGDSESNASSSASGSDLNTSGWAVGRSTATGGDLSSSKGGLSSFPWYGWLAVTLVAVAVIKRA